MIILRIGDRVPVKIGEVTFWLTPLTQAQKTELLAYFKQKSGEEVVDKQAYAHRAARMAIKAVEGLKLIDNSEYQLTFDENEELTQECLEELLGLQGSQSMLSACDRFVFQGVEGTSELEGVTIDLSKAKSLKKKS